MAYLAKREGQMQYPTFLAAGWPIGDGAVESANKLVVEARLTGSGMHWSRPHVDPMLALRNIASNDRWDEAWPQIVRTLRQQEQQRRAERRHKRRTASSNTPTQPTAPQQSAVAPPSGPVAATDTNVAAETQPSRPPAQVQPGQPWRPPANHPWRHMPVGRVRFRTTEAPTAAKP